MITFLEFVQRNPIHPGYNTGKRTKDDETANGADSSINKVLKYRDWTFKPTTHAASQAKDRRPEFSLDDWKKMHAKVHAHVTSDTSKTNGEHLFHSKSADQSYVANVDHKNKEIRVITVLPKGKHNPKEGTKKYTMEGVEVELIYVELE